MATLAGVIWLRSFEIIVNKCIPCSGAGLEKLLDRGKGTLSVCCCLTVNL